MHCTYDPATRGGNAPDGRKVKSHDPLGLGRARHRRRGAALRKPVHQARSERRAEGPGFHGQPESEFARSADRLQAGADAGRRRRRATGTSSSGWAISAWIRIPTPGKLVFNRTVTLRDTWAKIEKKSEDK